MECGVVYNGAALFVFYSFIHSFIFIKCSISDTNHCRTDQCSPIIKIATKSTKKDKVSEQVYIYKRGLKPSGIIHNTKIQNIFIRHNNILGAEMECYGG